MYEKWKTSRSETIPEFQLQDSVDMNYWLQRFIVEARRQDGKDYPPESLCLIDCGLLWFLRDKTVYVKNFLDEKNVAFVEFRKVLDTKMKSLTEKGIECTTKQADPILPEEEAKLWDVGVFGRQNAEQLLKIVFFMRWIPWPGMWMVHCWIRHLENLYSWLVGKPKSTKEGLGSWTWTINLSTF